MSLSNKGKNLIEPANDAVPRLRSVNTQTSSIRMALDETHEGSFEALKSLMEAYAEPIHREIEAYLHAHPKPWLVAAGVKDAACDLAQEFIEKRVLAPATPGQNIFGEALEKDTKPKGWAEPMRFRDKVIVALRQFVEKESLKPLRRPGLAGNAGNISLHGPDDAESETEMRQAAAAAGGLSSPVPAPGVVFAIKLKLDLALAAVAVLRTAERGKLTAVEHALTAGAKADIPALAKQARWRAQDLRSAVGQARASGLRWDQPEDRTQFATDWMQRWEQILQCAAKASTTRQKVVAEALGLSPAQMAQEVLRLIEAYQKAVLELGRQRGLSPEELDEVVTLRPPILEGEG